MIDSTTNFCSYRHTQHAMSSTKSFVNALIPRDNPCDVLNHSETLTFNMNNNMVEWLGLHNLLHRDLRADLERRLTANDVAVITCARSGKWDTPKHFEDDCIAEGNLQRLQWAHTHGIRLNPHLIDAAKNAGQHAIVEWASNLE